MPRCALHVFYRPRLKSNTPDLHVNMRMRKTGLARIDRTWVCSSPPAVPTSGANRRCQRRPIPPPPLPLPPTAPTTRAACLPRGVCRGVFCWHYRRFRDGPPRLREAATPPQRESNAATYNATGRRDDPSTRACFARVLLFSLRAPIVEPSNWVNTRLQCQLHQLQHRVHDR